MRRLILAAVAAVVCVSAAGAATTPAESPSVTAARASYCHGTTQSLMLAVAERKLEGAGWPGVNLCCVKNNCTWKGATPTSPTFTGTVILKAGTKNVWAVTLPALQAACLVTPLVVATGAPPRFRVVCG